MYLHNYVAEAGLPPPGTECQWRELSPLKNQRREASRQLRCWVVLRVMVGSEEKDVVVGQQGVADGQVLPTDSSH